MLIANNNFLESLLVRPRLTLSRESGFYFDSHRSVLLEFRESANDSENFNFSIPILRLRRSRGQNRTSDSDAEFYS